MKVILESVPASCQGSFQLSSALETPAKKEWCSFSLDRSSQYWAVSERAAARSPWSSWWGGEDGRGFELWQCQKALWSIWANTKGEKMFVYRWVLVQKAFLTNVCTAHWMDKIIHPFKDDHNHFSKKCVLNLGLIFPNWWNTWNMNEQQYEWINMNYE